MTKVNDLHRQATHYVSAKAQAQFIQNWLKEEALSEEEVGYFKKGRNAKSHSKAKNADSKTYSYSTGFEALMGYLYLSQQMDRFQELVADCIQQVKEESQ